MPRPAIVALLRLSLAATSLVPIAACTHLPRPASTPKLALVIGNAAYETVQPLANPANDLADMCTTLRKLGFTALCHPNVRDRAEFEARVKDYVDKLTPETVGVFYYSGHGVQAGGANYLIPTQAQLKTGREDPRQVLYPVDNLFERLRQRPTQLQVVILDACRTDLFAAPPRSAAGKGAALAARSSLLRALDSVPQATSSLAKIENLPRSTMVLYATASKEAAFDGKGRNGPLTKHVLAHIGSRGVGLDEFMNRVTRSVETETDRDYHQRQTPFKSGSFAGEFCFGGCAKADVPGVN